jgi:hypothetical protein
MRMMKLMLAAVLVGTCYNSTEAMRKLGGEQLPHAVQFSFVQQGVSPKPRKAHKRAPDTHEWTSGAQSNGQFTVFSIGESPRIVQEEMLAMVGRLDMLHSALYLTTAIYGEGSPVAQQLHAAMEHAPVVATTIQWRDGSGEQWPLENGDYHDLWLIRWIVITRRVMNALACIVRMNEPTLLSMKIPNITGGNPESMSGVVATTTGQERRDVPPNSLCMLEAWHTHSADVLATFNINAQKRTTNLLKVEMKPVEGEPNDRVVIFGRWDGIHLEPEMIAARDLRVLQGIRLPEGMPTLVIPDTPQAMRSFKNSKHETLRQKARLLNEWFAPDAPIVPVPAPIVPAPEVTVPVFDGSGEDQGDNYVPVVVSEDSE